MALMLNCPFMTGTTVVLMKEHLLCEDSIGVDADLSFQTGSTVVPMSGHLLSEDYIGLNVQLSFQNNPVVLVFSNLSEVNTLAWLL